MTTVALGAPPSTAEQLAGLPGSVTLSRAALEHLAAASRIVLPWHVEPARSGRRLAEALGGAGAEPPSDPQSQSQGRAATAPADELVEAGVTGRDGRPVPAVAAALLAFASAEVAVDLDLAATRPDAPHGSAQLHAWHRLSGERVTTLTYAGGDRLELGWFGSAWWQQTLGRLVPDDGTHRDEAAPGPGLVLPLAVWLGAGEALRTGRPDLLAVLLERHRGLVLDPTGVPCGPAETEHQVRLVHETARGRLRAVVAGTGPRRRIGLVSWLRYADGWRALTPTAGRGGLAVRLDPVTPPRLGAEIARLVAGVRA